MIDCNAGSYTSGGVHYDGGVIYTDSGTSGGVHWVDYDSYYYPRQESPPVTIIERVVEVPAPEPQKHNRKENDMINARQTFLDALMDEGKSLTSEEREIVRDAKQDKLELLFARLLARVFESADLAILKEKPKEVLIKEA